MIFSKMQLGTAQFGLNYGVANTAGKPSYETAKDIISAAYDGGINTLDTAAAYGNSEEVIGRALNELNLQEKFQIISKVPPVSSQHLSSSEAEKFIINSVEKSLRRLQVDHLDICLFHQEADIKYMDVLNKLKLCGLINGYGVSLDSTAYCQVALALDIGFIQLPYNILDKRFDDFLLKASARNIKIFTRSVYLQGLLLMPEDRIKPFLQEIIPVRRKLNQLAKSSGIGMAELCVRFVLSNQSVTSILSGVDNLSQLQENLKLIEKGILPDNLYKEINKTVPIYPEKIVRPTKWNEG